MASKRKPNELTLTRLYDAPVKTVWDAWTDPEKAAKWWGPRGFTITTHSKDLQPGGTWRYTMHGPDGTDYPNVAKYLEVEKYSRLVYDHGGTDDRPPLFRVTVLFAEVRGKTRMEMTMALPTEEAARETKKFIKKAGGDSTWDRFAEYLNKEATGEELFVINRAFEAPIATLFEMWMDPGHLSRWLPPAGFRMEFLKSDIRAGGTCTFFMTNDQGLTHYGRIDYQEISFREKIAYTQQFTDKDGKVSRHPLVPNWPETMGTTVTFHEEGPDQTRVTVRWQPQGTVTRDELDAFVKMKGSMTQGWTGSFDKLESLLAESGKS